MKISFISTNSNPCPPIAYGGESYYWNIAHALARRSHEVSLFAPGGSQTPPGGKHYIIDGNLLEHTAYINGNDYNVMVGDAHKETRVYEKYKDILLASDIVHDCSHRHLVAEHLRDYHGWTKTINTINGNCFFMPRQPFNMVVGSKSWKESALKGLTGFENTPWHNPCAYVGKFKDARIISWGVDTGFYCPSDYKKEDYFIWISRFHPTKGLHLAINLAKEIGFKLYICGSTDAGDHFSYAKMYFEMMKGHKNIEYKRPGFTEQLPFPFMVL